MKFEEFCQKQELLKDDKEGRDKFADYIKEGTLINDANLEVDDLAEDDLQTEFDEFISENPEFDPDYIHDEDEFNNDDEDDN